MCEWSPEQRNPGIFGEYRVTDTTSSRFVTVSRPCREKEREQVFNGTLRLITTHEEKCDRVRRREDRSCVYDWYSLFSTDYEFTIEQKGTEREKEIVEEEERNKRGKHKRRKEIWMHNFGFSPALSLSHSVPRFHEGNAVTVLPTRFVFYVCPSSGRARVAAVSSDIVYILDHGCLPFFFSSCHVEMWNEPNLRRSCCLVDWFCLLGLLALFRVNCAAETRMVYSFLADIFKGKPWTPCVLFAAFCTK